MTKPPVVPIALVLAAVGCAPPVPTPTPPPVVPVPTPPLVTAPSPPAPTPTPSAEPRSPSPGPAAAPGRCGPVTTAADAARPAAQQAQAKVVEDALGAGALALDHWETALGKAELLHSRGITNTGALIGAQGDMVQARNRAIKARQQALDAVNDFITGINDRVTATGVGDQRGKRAYDAYQCTIARFDAIEARHTPAFERLTRHIGKLMGM